MLAPEPSCNRATSPASTAALNASRISQISSTRPGSRSRCQPPTLQKNSLPKSAFSSCQLICVGHGRLTIALRERLKLVPRGRRVRATRKRSGRGMGGSDEALETADFSGLLPAHQIRLSALCAKSLGRYSPSLMSLWRGLGPLANTQRLCPYR